MESKKSITDLIDGLNIPKHLLKRSEELLISLFGPSMKDAGGLIADQIKLRRFKNQITIFEKAREFVKEKAIDPKAINLKVLAPMVEFSSLEEDETLQNKWSNLIANTLTEERHVRLEQKCVKILSQISSDEAVFFDHLYFLARKSRDNLFKRYQTSNSTPQNVKSVADINLETIYISVNQIKESVNIYSKDVEILLEGLISLEVMKWDVPYVDVSAEKSWDDPEDRDIDVDVTVEEPEGVYLTHFGVEFLEICGQ